MKNKVFLSLLLALCCVFMLKTGFAMGATIFSDDFNSYNNDEIVGQGDWTGTNNRWWIIDDDVLEGAKALKSKGGGGAGITRIGSAQTDGQFTIYIKQYHDNQDYGGLQFALCDVSYCQIAIGVDYDLANKIYYQTNAPPYFNEIADTIYGEWFYIQVKWQADGYFQYNINGGGWSELIEVQFPAYWAGSVDRLRLLNSSNSDANDYPVVDYISEDTPQAEIYLTTPVSGSTITDDTTELVGGWTNIDFETWTNIKMAFVDLQINETSAMVNVAIDDIDGEFSIPLSDFKIPHNGGWNLRAIVENNYEYNFDIANPLYNLIFNVGTWATPYEFTDFETWYDENVSDYETASDWAISMVGFLNPIFESIGQFGNRITEYLDTSSAYEKGFQIGGVFPVINAYILKIDIFFGGFPIVQFFKWGILLMIGLFAVKVIFKLLAFIPFFGGGG